MEMNIFAPQSIEARIELEEIADLKLQIITPQSSSPTIAMKQDQVIGIWNLTIDGFELDWRTSMNLLAGMELDKYDVIKRNSNVSGKDIFTQLVPPKINILKGNPEKPSLLIKNGKLEAGAIGNDAIGVGKKNSIVQLVWDEYGVDKTKQLLDNMTRLATHFNLIHGMTYGIRDIYVNDKTTEQMKTMIAIKKLQILHEISELENNPDMISEELFEQDINSRLAIIRDDVGKLLVANSENNNFMIFMNSGANKKCNPINMAQISGCVGQQDFHGERMKKNYNERALPYFFKNDDRPKSRGFIEKSFMTGLTLPDFIFHNLSSREGLIDGTVRSVAPDTKIVVVENSIPKVVEIGPWIDSQINLVATSNPELIETGPNDFELVKVNSIQIPTLDMNGNVSWGDVSAITRHGVGKQLYEIVTNSGRKVIVPESKSMLVWNSDILQFEEKLTPDIVIGDCVPTMFNLANYVNEQTFIDMKKYVESDEELNNLNETKFELNEQNGKFIGLYLADGTIYKDNHSIQIHNSNKYIVEFVEKWFDLNDVLHSDDIGSNDFTNGDSIIISTFIEKLAGNLEFINMKAHFQNVNTKHIPNETLNAPKDFIVGLLNGYISKVGFINDFISNIQNTEDEFIVIPSKTDELADGINYCLSRLGIFAEKVVKVSPIETLYVLLIKNQWIVKLMNVIGDLMDLDKNKKFNSLCELSSKKNYSEQNDVMLDVIKEINLISSNKYDKLYDLTIPSTLNFIIFNGLGVRDTADSGYVQRKLIKATEDMMVNYDGTVRNAVGRILQFQYGDSGADTVKQYEYNFKVMDMGNKELEDKYGMSKEELNKVKDWSDKDDRDFIKLMKNIRNKLRKTQIKTTLNYLTLNTSYMLPVNLYRILDNYRNNESLKGVVCSEPKYILDTIKEILEPYNTRLYCLTPDEIKDKNSVKYRDDQVAKTAFGYALTDILAPKKCIFQYNLSKKQIDGIKNEVIKSFNKSIVEPGEMVGIVAAQSLGEPVTQLMLNSFHVSGVGGKGGSNIGVDRIKEVFSLSKNPKDPEMSIYFNNEYRNKKDFANKIASHIKYTTIKDLRTKIETYYDPEPNEPDGFIAMDKVGVPFYTYQANKQCCANSIEGLPWLMRIEFNREKMMMKEITLLDIKSQFCFAWEKRYSDIKGMKKEKKQLIDKITQIAIQSNTDNDDIPIIHIRFDMTNFTQNTLVDFMDIFVDEFKLKGMPNIEDIRGNGKAYEERVISFDNPEGIKETKSEYVIYTKGINMEAIKNIIGVDLNRTYCSDIIAIYENFGIEAARNFIIREIIKVLTTNGSGTNFQHIEVFGDLMALMGTLTSIDRHGLNKLDTDPLSRASFEQTVDQLVTAAIFNEVDYMKSVSSRIMAGLCIKGGTGLCNMILDKDLLENSEYTTDIGQLYHKTYNDITSTLQTQEIDNDVFVPEM